MKIVVDTNVVISGVFFGGNPRQIIEAIVSGDNDLLIIGEYKSIQVITAKDFCEMYLPS